MYIEFQGDYLEWTTLKASPSNRNDGASSSSKRKTRAKLSIEPFSDFQDYLAGNVELADRHCAKPNLAHRRFDGPRNFVTL
jgi:hypothetical protein